VGWYPVGLLGNHYDTYSGLVLRVRGETEENEQICTNISGEGGRWGTRILWGEDSLMNSGLPRSYWQGVAKAAVRGQIL
jgi:hypothetical protein